MWFGWEGVVEDNPASCQICLAAWRGIGERSPMKHRNKRGNPNQAAGRSLLNSFGNSTPSHNPSATPLMAGQ